MDKIEQLNGELMEQLNGELMEQTKQQRKNMKRGCWRFPDRKN